MDDQALLDQFENLTLPFTEWSHRTHVKVAWIYLSRHPREEAIARMRAGIKAYNAKNDVPEGPLTGYDETTTVAFMHIVHAMRVAYAEYCPADTADAFCDAHPQLLQKHILRLFYSPAQRMHPEAKERFIEPDLARLPQP